jgi:hypothetical protein
MALFRWSPLVFALLSAAGSSCRERTDVAGPAAKADGGASSEVTIKEVDTSALTPRERREWAAQVGELLAPCPETPVSIAQCASEHRACKTCIPAAQFLLRQVQAGKPKKDREDAFHARFDANKTKTIVLDGSPEFGPPDAPITLVEWADFECPFCRLMYPMIEELARKRFEGQVRVVYKFYPLGAHPHGEVAARAALGAAQQGKFWEMHHLLFDNQDKLELGDLEGYARQLGLDLRKFKTDVLSPEATARIERDKKQADQLGFEGTPFLFVNGREVDMRLLGNPYDDLEAWLKLDLELAGKTPKPAASASAFAPNVGPGSPPPPASAAAGLEPKR